MKNLGQKRYDVRQTESGREIEIPSVSELSARNPISHCNALPKIALQPSRNKRTSVFVLFQVE